VRAGARITALDVHQYTSVTRAQPTSPPPHTPEFARGYIQHLARGSAIDPDMAEFQIAAIAAAARAGRPILIVEDVDAATPDQRLTHAA
jgi:hypothetical protein